MKFCPQCGEKVSSEKIKFCIKCGYNFTSEISQEIPNIENNIDKNVIPRVNKDTNNQNIPISKKNIFKIIGSALILGCIGLGFYYLDITKAEREIRKNIDASNNANNISDDDFIEKKEIVVERNIPSLETSQEKAPSSTQSKEEVKENSSETIQEELREDKNIDIDEKAKTYLIDHYNDIASHNFSEAFSHFNSQNFKVNGKIIKKDGITPPENTKFANASLSAFSFLWKSVKKIEITNFEKVGELNYSYLVTITFDNGIKEIYDNKSMKLSHNGNDFSIIEYTASLKK